MNENNQNLGNYAAQQTAEQSTTKENVAPKYERYAFKPMEMNGVSKTAFTTTKELGNSIAKALRRASNDIAYCIIKVDPQMGLVANLALVDNAPSSDETKFKFLQSRQKAVQSKSTLGRLIDSSKPQRKGYVELTEAGKAMLEEFVPRWSNKQSRTLNIDLRTKRVIWEKATAEKIDRGSMWGEPKVLLLVQFDLKYFLFKVYGDKDKDGNQLDYLIAPIRPLDEFVDQRTGARYSTNYLISYTQVNKNELQDALEKANIGNRQEGFFDF